MDEQYARSPDPGLYKERLRLQAEYDLISTSKEEQLLLKSRHKFYEHGDKASKLLASQARHFTSSRLIPQIKSPTGTMLTNLKDINDHFSVFYASLYSSECQDSTVLIDSFFENITLTPVDEQLNSKLENPLTLSEIAGAITAMQSGKSPGPDGFCVKFYKISSSLLSPLLLAMFTESFDSGHLPPTLTQASISLLAKKDKDPTLCESYRPISLLNVDFKILAKALALRLETLLPSIISVDQSGFIQKRHSFHNVRRLFNVIYTPSQSDAQEIIVSLDAEKAFDWVEWTYHFATMQKFGLSPSFVSWVKLLYSSPMASVCSNSVHSPYFQLQRGTRQGCPLSPLLFVIAIEPLAISLHQCPHFSGITRDNIEHKVSLYADDLPLYISNPTLSVPPILSVLQNFGKISGYKLNFSKSEYFTISTSISPLTSSIPFKETQNGFRYLGIMATHSFNALFKHNFGQLLDRCKEDLARWSALPLSLAGRINLIKMIVLPRFLYLFLNVPIFIKKSFFNNLDKLILSFVWGSKGHRIRKSFLQRQKKLALHNFLFYYWASNIQKILFWTDHSETDGAPAWVRGEKSCSQFSLSSIVCSSLPLCVKITSSNPIVSHTLRIWSQFRKHFGLQEASVLSPIISNIAFIPSNTDAAFQLWHKNGIGCLKDLFSNNIFLSFEQVSQTFNLPRTHFFRYLQMRHFVQKKFSSFPNLPPLSPTDELLDLNPTAKGLISTIYTMISSINPQMLDHLRQAWEQDLDLHFSEVEWDGMIDQVHSSSPCARHGLIQFKVLHRLHITNSRLARIFPNINPSCNRCNHSPCTLAHMFWFCPALETFWRKIFKSFSEISGLSIDPNPLIAIFGVRPDGVTFSNSMYDFIAFTTLLARRLILLKWKHTSPPTHTRWIKDVLLYIKLEKIKFTLRGSLKKFHKMWIPFLVYY